MKIGEMVKLGKRAVGKAYLLTFCGGRQAQIDALVDLIQNEDVKKAEFMLSVGCETNGLNSEIRTDSIWEGGISPLHAAIMSKNRYRWNMIDMLLLAGANPNIKNAN